MKKKAILGTGIATVLAALFLSACHHNKSPEARAGWIKDEIADRLTLNEPQKQTLDEIASGLLERKQQMREDREAIRETVVAELRKDKIDRDAIDALVAKKRRQMDELVDYMVDSAVRFHSELTPEQRETLVAEIEKYHARAQKYRGRHHPW